jgi:hypothetical protein
MTLSKSVEESLREAESSLRNALAYSARQEKPFVSREISEIICRIDTLIKTDQLLDKLENRKMGDRDIWGTFFEDSNDS